MAPRGVSVHTERIWGRGGVTWEEEHERIHTLDAVDYIKNAGVNIIVFGCTSGCFFGGVEWERRLKGKLKARAGLPVITTMRAVIEALNLFNAKKIVMATPYVDAMTEKEKVFLEDIGFEVLKMKGLQIEGGVNLGYSTPDTAYKLAKEIFVPQADAIFISCTGFRTIEVIELLERDLGKPVVTSGQSSFWAAMKALKIKEEIKGYGRLLEEYL